MAGPSKKSTKKFEKKHLKDTLERRKEFAKTKQRHQAKAKKKARSANDIVKGVEEEVKTVSSKPETKSQDRLNEMSVDQFFEGGFQLPELKKAKGTTRASPPQNVIGKRKRDTEKASTDGTDGGSEVLDQAFSDVAAASDEADGSENHQEDLDALAAKDPDFYKYLQENDAELLDFGAGDLAEVDQLSEEDAHKKKRKKDQGPVVEELDEVVENREEEQDGGPAQLKEPTISKWRSAMTEQYSLRAMRQVVLAFRTAAYINADDGKSHKYSISSPEVYHQLLMLALDHVPTVLNHHLPVKESATGKVRIAMESKKYRTLTPLLQAHSAAVIHLLENLSDAPTTKRTLNALLPLLPYLLSFKKVLKSLVQCTVNIWSDTSTTDPTRITAFLVIRRLAVLSDTSIRTALLKTTYQGLVKGSRVTNAHTLPAINLMKNSAAELWGIDRDTGYATGFVYIRQLAVHLRSSITQPTKDSYKQIYNWQYIHSLDFWSRVIAIHCSPTLDPSLKASSDSSLHPLLYPLVQITLGALRLIPTPTYYPLRFQLTRSLLRLSRATTTYIPLAPSLLEVFQSTEMTKPPKPSTLKSLDFGIILRVPKPYLRTRTYQDGLGEQLVELVAEFFGIWAKHIAFPELMLPPVVHLKRWLKMVSSAVKAIPNGVKTKSGKLKGNKNARLTSSVSLLVQKLESNARWIEDGRRQVEFGPSNRDGVENFLRDTPVEETPLGSFVEGLRKRSEEREKLLERAREAERKDRVKDRADGAEEEVNDVEEDVLEDDHE